MVRPDGSAGFSATSSTAAAGSHGGDFEGMLETALVQRQGAVGGGGRGPLRAERENQESRPGEPPHAASQ